MVLISICFYSVSCLECPRKLKWQFWWERVKKNSDGANVRVKWNKGWVDQVWERGRFSGSYSC